MEFYMSKIKKRYIILIILGCFILFVWLKNTSLFADKADDYKLLAHRGLAQTFDISQVEWDTNTAEIIYEPEHEYLENTIESMEAAFSYGADAVELDIQGTKDGLLAVFHDYDLSMRTDGEGEVSEYTMEELKQLDIGYGYTADNGKSYPFRGQGIGRMPELKEVLELFPDKELLIHIKDSDLETAKTLWTYLESMSPERSAQMTFYGNEEGLTYLREQNSSIRVFSVKLIKNALIKYELLGWTGYIPKEMHNMEILIPLKWAKYLWGWPHKFVERMESVNTRVVLVEGNGKWSEGFDTVESVEKIPKGFSGYVWTNRIDLISEKYSR
jgi:glycerophosphoryl diester phosphodiesterase